jgi:ribonucleoside-diphosphate reductase alpha chain
MAENKGTFSGYQQNSESMLKVIGMHRDAAYDIPEVHCPDYMLSAAKNAWDAAFDAGIKSGYRNSQVTVLAPTGTIGFMMDCDTTGVEPDIALVKYKMLAGGGMLKIVNRTVPMALDGLGYSAEDIREICDNIDNDDTIETAAKLREEHLRVFDCAFKPINGNRHIHYQAHLKMMAATQPFLSGAISKTINMPQESTTEDIASAYMEGWEMGLKAIAVYRDNSKRIQPVNVKKDGKAVAAKKTSEEPSQQRPYRRRLSETRNSITHKFSVAGHEGYLTVGLYEDGQPGELFITMAKEGSTVGGLMDVIGTCVSMSLQYGVPLITLVDKFRHARFEPAGMTANKNIPFAKSLIDYIFCWMGCQFIVGYMEKNTPQRSIPSVANKTNTTAKQLVEKTKDLAKKIVEVKAIQNKAAEGPKPSRPFNTSGGMAMAAAAKAEGNVNTVPEATSRFAEAAADRAVAMVSSAVMAETKTENDATVLQLFNEQFKSFQDDAPACDVCGSITVRNGTCYRCYNCGNSMGCS